MSDKGPLARWTRLALCPLKARTMSVKCSIKTRIRIASRSRRLPRRLLDVLSPLVRQSPTTHPDSHEAQTDQSRLKHVHYRLGRYAQADPRRCAAIAGRGMNLPPYAIPFQFLAQEQTSDERQSKSGIHRI
jgi:hypothetical protein